MPGCLEAAIRANTNNYGDIEATVLKNPKLKNAAGRCSISLIDGKVICWTGLLDDVEIKKSSVSAINLIAEKVMVSDLSSGGGKTKMVNIYSITIDGETYAMRLITGSAAMILAKLQ